MKPIIHKNLTEAEWLELRKRNINSSEVAALFGHSTYTTAYEVWNIKAGELDDQFVMNDRVEAGQFLEPSIAAWAAHKLGCEAGPFKDYYELPELRIGASFDWEITQWDNMPPQLDGCTGPGIMEVKNVDYLQFKGSFKNGYSDRKWNDDDPDNILMPLHIELQVQDQLMVSGRTWAVIAVLVGGNDLKFVFRKRREDIIQKLFAGIAAFWKSIDENICPDPDFARDYDTLRALYAVPDPREALADEVLDEAMDAVAVASAAGAEKRAAEKREKEAKTRVMAVMKAAEMAVLPDGGKISWKANKHGTRTLRLTASPVPREEVNNEAA